MCIPSADKVGFYTSSEMGLTWVLIIEYPNGRNQPHAMKRGESNVVLGPVVGTQIPTASFPVFSERVLVCKSIKVLLIVRIRGPRRL